MKGIMVQGTSSDSGKSFLVTALCRLLSDRGFRICPFKSQNMSNNACVTRDGREMSRAQAVQAEAARLEPETFMNPILLKPRRDVSSEIVLEGHALDTPAERGYYRTFTRTLGIEAVRRALRRIEERFDAVVIEGAGSPAEVNLNEFEIVNMCVAREADVPVLLVTDVDRGGSLASIVGTLELLEEDRGRVRGLIFNKFRGDRSLFDPAVGWIERRTGVPVLGVMPWVEGAAIAGEDSLNVHWGRTGGEGLSIGVVRFPGLSNFTDLDPFELEPDVELVGLDADTPERTLHSLDAVLLPGSKNTMRDMAWLERTGLARAVRDLSRAGRCVFGLCGGYQMLGERLLDPDLKENSEIREIEGLGLLPSVTAFGVGEKRTIRTEGRVRRQFSADEVPVAGYEIHFGVTRPVEGSSCPALLDVTGGGVEGMARPDLSVAGTYLHGIFDADAFRALWLNVVRRSRGLEERAVTDTRAMKERAYDALARAAERHLNVGAILRLMGLA